MDVIISPPESQYSTPLWSKIISFVFNICFIARSFLYRDVYNVCFVNSESQCTVRILQGLLWSLCVSYEVQVQDKAQKTSFKKVETVCLMLTPLCHLHNTWFIKNITVY